ncbi:MAG: hypothetical protein AB7S26_29855 [Sandaracinaceae bacterium]
MDEDEILVRMTSDEAVVLLSWLHRFNQDHQRIFEDQSEQRALWNLEATLEARLTAVVAENYRDVLAAARQRLRDPTE